MLEFVRRHMHSIGKRVILPASFTGGRRYQEKSDPTCQFYWWQAIPSDELPGRDGHL